MYARDDEFGRKQSDDFKATFSITVQVDFLGIWCFSSIEISASPLLLIILSIPRDCVSSVGLIPHSLPMTNDGVRIYRHAVALDERRAKFKPNLLPIPSELEKNHLPPALEVWFTGK